RPGPRPHRRTRTTLPIRSRTSISRRETMRAFLVLATALLGTGAFAEGNVERGGQLYRACAPCHSLEPNKNLTGPSLSGLWDRHAGGLQSFMRYSEALKSSGIIWDETSLDPWIAEPRTFIPDNEMTFRGIADKTARADLIAFLREATRPGSTLAAQKP